MFTNPTIVTSNDLKKRSYITFYFNNERVREYNGRNIGKRINPNRATTLSERNTLLATLRFELHKALESGAYPISETANKNLEKVELLRRKETAQSLLLQALNNKLNSDLSKTYKRDLNAIHRQFTSFALPTELNGQIEQIPTTRIEMFLNQFASSGTYYMNKRRTLAILFSAAGRLIDEPIKAVRETERKRAKAKLHQAYEDAQLKPILAYLKANYSNLYLCCLITYGAWLRPHEEIRLLKCEHFKKDNTEVHLSGDENKGGKVRIVYIPDYVQRELAPILSSIGRDINIFSRTEKPFNESYFNTQWSRAYKKMFELGLIYKNQTIYSFRHTAAVNTYKRTKDVYLLQKLLGHSTIVVTLKYLRSLGEFNSEELKKAAPIL